MTAFMDFGDGLTWRKASFSGSDNGGCLFVCADDGTGMVGVRDSNTRPIRRSGTPASSGRHSCPAPSPASST